MLGAPLTDGLVGGLGDPFEHDRLNARRDRALEALGVARATGYRRHHTVTQPTDRGLQRAEQFAGADDVLPAGQHLAPHHGAVAHVDGDVPHRSVEGVPDPVAEPAQHLDLILNRDGHPLGTHRQLADGPDEGASHQFGAGVLVSGE